MAGDEMVRQRKVLRKGLNRNDYDDAHVVSKQSHKIVLCTTYRAILVAFIASLVYANYSSPIKAKIIPPVKSAEDLPWANVDNTYLKNGVRILQNLHGPESVAIDKANGYIYTGTHDGKIFRITDVDAPSPIVTDMTAQLKNGPYTAGGNNDKLRPLGLRLRGNQLYVADAYQGIFSIDLSSNTWKKIVGYNDVTPQLTFADDLALHSDGTKLYFTDMSERWQYNEMAYSVSEGDCSGRVMVVDLKTQVTKVLQSQLCFPNGIELNPTDTIIAVSESQRSRVLLLNIETGDILREIPMPGNSDNIRRSNTGGYWVGIPTPTIRFIQLTRNFPTFRNIAARIFGPKWLFFFLDMNKGMVVKLDDDFVPIAIHKDFDGEVSRSITEVAELDDGFLLCSFVVHGFVKIEKLPVTNNIVQPL